jgi:hypothetical protein
VPSNTYCKKYGPAGLIQKSPILGFGGGVAETVEFGVYKR